jgi:phage-related protein
LFHFKLTLFVQRQRQILLYKDYFKEFFEKQTGKVKEKIDYVLYLIRIADKIPSKIFKHIEGTNGLYEIRIESGGNIYRIFSCFDEGNLIVLFNGFQKKSQKTPITEIKKALNIRKEYSMGR